MGPFLSENKLKMNKIIAVYLERISKKQVLVHAFTNWTKDNLWWNRNKLSNKWPVDKNKFPCVTWPKVIFGEIIFNYFCAKWIENKRNKTKLILCDPMWN